MAGAATARGADAWKTAESLRLAGIERSSEAGVERSTRVQERGQQADLRGVARRSCRRSTATTSVPMATNVGVNCHTLEVSPSLRFRRHSQEPQQSVSRARVNGTSRGVTAVMEVETLCLRVMGSASERLRANTCAGARKSAASTVGGWRIYAEREQPLVRSTTTRMQSQNLQQEKEKEEEPFVRPPLPGDEPDFWEGEQWEWLGFVLQYLWAVGIVVAVIGGLVAVRTYNSGAVDYKQTVEYQAAMEFMESRKADSTSSESSSLPPEAPPIEAPPPSE